jgi:hypothetical protein
MPAGGSYAYLGGRSLMDLWAEAPQDDRRYGISRSRPTYGRRTSGTVTDPSSF